VGTEEIIGDIGGRSMKHRFLYNDAPYTTYAMLRAKTTSPLPESTKNGS